MTTQMEADIEVIRDVINYPSSARELDYDCAKYALDRIESHLQSLALVADFLDYATKGLLR